MFLIGIAQTNLRLTYQVVSKVVTDIHLFNFSVLLFCLDETVFKKVVVVLLHLLVSHVGQMRPIGRLGRVLGIDVQVLKHNRLRERRLVVQPEFGRSK